MEFRDVKPPMPALRLPEDYVYNPLYFAANASAPQRQPKSPSSGAAASGAESHGGAHSLRPSSTYLHRPLHFVSASPHGTPPRRHSHVRDEAAALRRHTPPTSSQPSRRHSSAHGGNASLLRRATALTQEVAGWQGLPAALEDAREPQAEASSAAGTDAGSAAHRPTRTSRLRARRTSAALEDREEAESDIFYRPGGRQPSLASQLSLRPFTATTPASSPRRRSATPRSTKAAELRHRHSLLMMEELEELQRLRQAEATQQSRQAPPAPSPRRFFIDGSAAEDGRYERRAKESNGHSGDASGGQAGRLSRRGSAARSRRRSSAASVASSKDEMRAAVSTYLDEQERLLGERAAAAPPQQHQQQAARGEERDLDAPAALPAPKLRKQREPGTAQRPQSPLPQQRTAAPVEPPSPEPRPPATATAATASRKPAPKAVPPAVSSARTARSLPWKAREAAAAAQQARTSTPAAAAVPQEDTQRHAATACAPRRSPSGSSSSSYSSIEFKVSTPSPARHPAAPLAASSPALGTPEQRSAAATGRAAQSRTSPTPRSGTAVAGAPPPRESPPPSSHQRSAQGMKADSPAPAHGRPSSKGPAAPAGTRKAEERAFQTASESGGRAAAAGDDAVPCINGGVNSREAAVPKRDAQRLPRRNEAGTTQPLGEGTAAPNTARAEQPTARSVESAVFSPVVVGAGGMAAHEGAAEEETVLSQSFASLHSFHADDDAPLHTRESSPHRLPAPHPAAASASASHVDDDAAHTQAELLRYYRSANASSVGPQRHAPRPCPAASLPMRTIPGDDLGDADTAQRPHTAVEEIDGAPAVSSRSASSEGAGSHDADRSAVSTPTTASSVGGAASSSSSRSGSRSGWASHQAGEVPQRTAAASSFLVDAVADFGLLRGAVVALVAGESDAQGRLATTEPLGHGSRRSWGLPVPPTNHTHADAAWAAKERGAASSLADPPLWERARRVSAAEPAPPYHPRMEGPVWKDALDTVQLPQLQESNRSALPTPDVSRHTTGEASVSVGTALRRYEFPVSLMELRSSLSVGEGTGGGAGEVDASAVSASSIPSSVPQRSVENSPAAPATAARSSRLPPRTHAAEHSAPAAGGGRAETEVPQLAGQTRPATVWSRQQPFTVGGTPPPPAEQEVVSVRPPRRVTPLMTSAPAAVVVAAGKARPLPPAKAEPRAVAHSDPAPTALVEQRAATSVKDDARSSLTPPRESQPSPTQLSPERNSSPPAAVGDSSTAASPDSTASTVPSDSGSSAVSKLAQWRARDEARRQLAAQSSATRTAERAAAAQRPAAVVEEGVSRLPPQLATAAPTRRAAPPPAAPAASPDPPSDSDSPSVGGETPLERSARDALSSPAEAETWEGEGTKRPLSHAPTPLPLRTPPPEPLAAPPEKPRLSQEALTTGAAAALSEPSSRAFSRSDASTRSLTNAPAEVPVSAASAVREEEEEAERAALVTPVPRSPQTEDSAEQQEGPSAEDSGPESAEATAVHDGSPLRSSAPEVAERAAAFLPLALTAAPAPEPVAPTPLEGRGSPERRLSEGEIDRAAAAATSHPLFSADSSSFGSTPAQQSTSLSTSLGVLEAEASERPLEPLRQPAPRRRGVQGDVPVVAAPPLSSQSTAAAVEEREAISSPYRPPSPLPGEESLATHSLASSGLPFNERASPERMWGDASPSTTEPLAAEEGLEVFKGLRPSPAAAPLTRVQYYHVDL